MGTSQFDIKNPPTDGITKIRFANLSNRLVVSSWDKFVRYYDVIENSLKLKLKTQSPVLDCCFSKNDDLIASGGLNGQIQIHELGKRITYSLDSHKKAVSTIDFVSMPNCLVTGSWDTYLSLWDLRNNQPRIATATVGNKIYSISASKNIIVVGTSARRILIYDSRNMSKPMQDRESILKHQIREIRCNSDHSSFLITSVEGRVAIEFYDYNEVSEKRKFVFKCHRHTDENTLVQTIFPVNCATYHPNFGTFATGGCDGFVNVWDATNKKRICQFPQFQDSISSIDFNLDGKLLAIAVSYTWEQGERDRTIEKITIRKVKDLEVQPKNRKNRK